MTRRLAAAIDDLAAEVPPERVEALESQRDLLIRAVDAHQLDPDERASALHPDRLGLG